MLSDATEKLPFHPFVWLLHNNCLWKISVSFWTLCDLLTLVFLWCNMVEEEYTIQMDLFLYTRFYFDFY